VRNNQDMSGASEQNFSQSSMGGGTTKELVYLQHILQTLTSAQTSFDTGNVERFNLYITYLENAVLDKDMRDKIAVERALEEKRLKDLKVYDDKNIEFRIGMIVVREIMQYLNEVLELEHVEIMGAVGIAEEIVPVAEGDTDDAYNLYEEDDEQ